MLAAVISSMVLMAPAETTVEGPPPPESSRLRRYLTRQVPYSARFIDHGVLQVSAAGGWPHLYALRMQLGLFDHERRRCHAGGHMGRFHRAQSYSITLKKQISCK